MKAPLIAFPIWSLLAIPSTASSAAEKITVTPYENNSTSCTLEKKGYAYHISNCETVTCLGDGGNGDDCQSAHMDTISNLTCVGYGVCDNVVVSNIQDGGTVFCQGHDACADSVISTAASASTEHPASYTQICDNPEEGGCGACEATKFRNGFGPNGTLICGRNGACSLVYFGVPLDDPDLCVICAFAGSCRIFEDDFGGEAFDGNTENNGNGFNPYPTTFGKGCGPADSARLCEFYRDEDFFFDLDRDGIDDCKGQQGNIQDDELATAGEGLLEDEEQSENEEEVGAAA